MNSVKNVSVKSKIKSEDLIDKKHLLDLKVSSSFTIVQAGSLKVRPESYMYDLKHLKRRSRWSFLFATLAIFLTPFLLNKLLEFSSVEVTKNLSYLNFGITIVIVGCILAYPEFAKTKNGYGMRSHFGKILVLVSDSEIFVDTSNSEVVTGNFEKSSMDGRLVLGVDSRSILEVSLIKLPFFKNGETDFLQQHLFPSIVVGVKSSRGEVRTTLPQSIYDLYPFIKWAQSRDLRVEVYDALEVSPT